MYILLWVKRANVTLVSLLHASGLFWWLNLANFQVAVIDHVLDVDSMEVSGGQVRINLNIHLININGLLQNKSAIWLLHVAMDTGNFELRFSETIYLRLVNVQFYEQEKLK